MQLANSYDDDKNRENIYNLTRGPTTSAPYHAIGKSKTENLYCYCVVKQIFDVSVRVIDKRTSA
jgi:hypothetical protein